MNPRATSLVLSLVAFQFLAMPATAQRARFNPEQDYNFSQDRFTIVTTNSLPGTERFSQTKPSLERYGPLRNTVEMELFNAKTNNILGLPQTILPARRVTRPGLFHPDFERPDIILPDIERVQRERPARLMPQNAPLTRESPVLERAVRELPDYVRPVFIRPEFDRPKDPNPDGATTSQGLGGRLLAARAQKECPSCSLAKPPRSCCAVCGRVNECPLCLDRQHPMPNGQYYSSAVNPLSRTIFAPTN